MLEQFLLFGENDLLLVAEVAEERGAADFGALGDVPDRDVNDAELHAEDRWAIGESLSCTDTYSTEAIWADSEEIFTPDVVYDLSDVGVGTFEGIEAIRRGALQLGAGNPIAHHVTNVVITSEEEDGSYRHSALH